MPILDDSEPIRVYGQVRGLDLTGKWMVRQLQVEQNPAGGLEFVAGSGQVKAVPSTRRVTAEIEMLSDESDIRAMVEGNRQYALSSAPDDVKEALKAVYELDDGLPRGKRAVIEVEAGGDDRPKFVVTVRDEDLGKTPEPGERPTLTP